MSNIAKEILIHLGGNQLVAMTGAKNFVAIPNGLTFNIPTIKNINTIEVIFNEETETCEMVFKKYIPKKMEFKVAVVEKDIYLDELRAFFEYHTSLATSLTHRYSVMVDAIREQKREMF